MRILIVEDDADLSAAMAEYFELQEAKCDFAYNGLMGVELAISLNFDVILLDFMLPKLDGFDVCSELRRRGCSTPVLMLTAMGTTEDQLGGFDAGVDDYVVKPCPMPLLWARINSLYRRAKNQQAMQELGPLKIDIESRELKREGLIITLTPTEWRILETLLQHSPKIVSRFDIEQFVWPDQEPDQGRLNVHLHALRKAIDKPFSYPLIKTVTGYGVCISAKN
ncbi:XRE family transcriptional regulator [Marinomonas primoryensis]|uniref:XRE family transcriptional regulator n=1 Tax=Marinomonas primoryensis TaxID=178399 RepID=A0A2Z4PXV6_9GAMM|nr:response regulator transcription factor [Marinomonas primoryensis]AWY02348.1 XRE family transcriptional regulator [Marinomonas primoryensis]